jgi:cysteine-rich repeat protein
MNRWKVLSLALPLTMGLLCTFAPKAAANHLHYIPVTDTQFPENDPTSLEYIPGWLIFDTYGELPLEQWVIYSGDDEFTTFSNNSLTMEASGGSGTAEVLFDAATFADTTNPSATAFYEFEVFTLDDSGLQTIEVGVTDLINQIKWDEKSGVISGSKAEVAGDDVNGVPRWSATGNLPLRLRIYYNFATYVITFVVIDDATGTETRRSWQGSGNPFQNFFFAVPGTDPDNLDIYSFVLCEAHCGVTILGSDLLNCDTVDGAIDVDGCLRPPGVGNGQFDPGETCEDGNTLSGDGCDSSGQLEKIGRDCQEAIGKAGGRYVQARLRNLQRCRNLLNRGAALFQDQGKTVAVTNRSECPSEFGIAGRLTNVGEKARRLVAARCTDTLVGAIAACGDTVDEIVSSDGTSGCLVETHDAGVDGLLKAEYGD